MIIDEINKIWQILNKHEEKFKNLNVSKLLKNAFKRKFRAEKQKDTYLGLHLALCVDTRDPWGQNRIRYFSPILNTPLSAGGAAVSGYPQTGGEYFTTRVDSLDWAWPINCLAGGGFDDSGWTGVPTPGSTVCILFQNGNPKSAFYIGTTWHRDKGPEDNDNFNYPIPEYNKIFKGHRKGYMVGKNDESQNLPPWNTDNYQGMDFDSTVDTNLVPDAYTKRTWPHIYGYKSPEKHMIRMDDGDPKCNRRYKRLEIQSSLGQYFLMKDDPYHYCGEWTNPKCQTNYLSIEPDYCVASTITYIDPLRPSYISVIPFSYTCIQGPEYCSTISEEGLYTPVQIEYLGIEHLCPGFSSPENIETMPVDCLSVLNRNPDWCHNFNNIGKNRYHKQKQECYPFLRGKCALVQGGIQLLSRAGAGLVMDDSVEEPRGIPEWEQSMEPFDFDGCTGNFKGRTYLESATQHFIELNDSEDQPKIRGIKNGIMIQTATGNEICMSDHTLDNCTAGPGRGVHIKSTANHTLDFCDNGNHQCSGERHGCTQTGAWANKAFVRLKSGYGIQIMMSDGSDQQKTNTQYFQILSPQKDNIERGPHMIHIQERATGPGQIFIKAGGDYIINSYDNMVEVVGDEKNNPSNKLQFISKSKIVSIGDIYYNKAKKHVFWAKDHILLLAGEDCEDSEGNSGSCVYPVVVATRQIPDFIQAQTGLKASEYIFASAKNTSDNVCDLIRSD